MLLFTCTLFSKASLLTLWHVSLTLLIFILDAKVTTNSWGYMPVVSQNVSDLPSIMCSGGYFGSAEDAKLTEVPAELKPMSNIFTHTIWNLQKDFFLSFIKEPPFFFIATWCPHIKLACGNLRNNALYIMWFALHHRTNWHYIIFLACPATYGSSNGFSTEIVVFASVRKVAQWLQY